MKNFFIDKKESKKERKEEGKKDRERDKARKKRRKIENVRISTIPYFCSIPCLLHRILWCSLESNTQHYQYHFSSHLKKISFLSLSCQRKYRMISDKR